MHLTTFAPFALVALPLSLVSARSLPRGDSCGIVGYDSHTNAYFYDDSGKYASYTKCSDLCLKDPNCQSFGWDKDVCMQFNVPVAGNVDKDKSSPTTYYDRGCINTPTTTPISTTSSTKSAGTTKSSTPSTTTTSSVVLSTNKTASSSSTSTIKAGSSTTAPSSTTATISSSSSTTSVKSSSTATTKNVSSSTTTTSSVIVKPNMSSTYSSTKSSSSASSLTSSSSDSSTKSLSSTTSSVTVKLDTSSSTTTTKLSTSSGSSALASSSSTPSSTYTTTTTKSTTLSSSTIASSASSTTSTTTSVTVPSGCPIPSAYTITAFSFFNSSHNLNCVEGSDKNTDTGCIKTVNEQNMWCDPKTDKSCTNCGIALCSTGLPPQPIGYGPPDDVKFTFAESQVCEQLNPAVVHRYPVGGGYVNCGSTYDFMNFYGSTDKDTESGRVELNGYSTTCADGSTIAAYYSTEFQYGCTRDAAGNATCTTAGSFTIPLLRYTKS